MLETYLVTLALITVAAGLIYLFLVWNFGKWTKRGVREVKSYPLVGSFPSAFNQKRHMTYDLDDIYRQHKNEENFVGTFMARTPQLMILDPDYVQKIYVNDFKHFHDNEISRIVNEKSDLILGNNPFSITGEKWKERRMEAVGGMTPSRIKTAYPVTLEVCGRFSDFIRKQIRMAPKDGINANDLCLRFTSEVVTDCVLGIKANSLSDKPTPILEMTKKLFDQSVIFLIYQVAVGLFPFIPFIYKMRFFPKYIEDFFYNLMKDSLALRLTNKSERVDFLNYLIQLQQKKNLGTPELTSHVMTFLTDGFITTATSVAHTLLMLARIEEKQVRLRDEILANLDDDGNVGFEKLSELPYLDACVHETLRIFPPLLFSNKLCTEPYELKNKDGTVLKLKADESVIIPIYSLHHDERFYKDPEQFQPERFLPENGDGMKGYRDQGKFLGFGNGPRICLGMRFALTQAKAAIVEVIKNFNIKPNPKTRTDNMLDKDQFLAILSGGIWLDFEPLK